MSEEALDRQWSIIVELNEALIDAKLELIRADARAAVIRGEQLLAEHPLPQRRISRFDEMALNERDPFG